MYVIHLPCVVLWVWIYTEGSVAAAWVNILVTPLCGWPLVETAVLIPKLVWCTELVVEYPTGSETAYGLFKKNIFE